LVDINMISQGGKKVKPLSTPGSVAGGGTQDWGKKDAKSQKI
jgi:hypothetical protein